MRKGLNIDSDSESLDEEEQEMQENELQEEAQEQAKALNLAETVAKRLAAGAGVAGAAKVAQNDADDDFIEQELHDNDNKDDETTTTTTTAAEKKKQKEDKNSDEDILGDNDDDEKKKQEKETQKQEAEQDKTRNSDSDQEEKNVGKTKQQQQQQEKKEEEKTGGDNDNKDNDNKSLEKKNASAAAASPEKEEEEETTEKNDNKKNDNKNDNKNEEKQDSLPGDGKEKLDKKEDNKEEGGGNNNNTNTNNNKKNDNKKEEQEKKSPPPSPKKTSLEATYIIAFCLDMKLMNLSVQCSNEGYEQIKFPLPPLKDDEGKRIPGFFTAQLPDYCVPPFNDSKSFDFLFYAGKGIMENGPLYKYSDDFSSTLSNQQRKLKVTRRVKEGGISFNVVPDMFTGEYCANPVLRPFNHMDLMTFLGVASQFLLDDQIEANSIATQAHPFYSALMQFERSFAPDVKKSRGRSYDITHPCWEYVSSFHSEVAAKILVTWILEIRGYFVSKGHRDLPEDLQLQIKLPLDEVVGYLEQIPCDDQTALSLFLRVFKIEKGDLEKVAGARMNHLLQYIRHSDPLIASDFRGCCLENPKFSQDEITIIRARCTDGAASALCLTTEMATQLNKPEIVTRFIARLCDKSRNESQVKQFGDAMKNMASAEQYVKQWVAFFEAIAKNPDSNVFMAAAAAAASAQGNDNDNNNNNKNKNTAKGNVTFVKNSGNKNKNNQQQQNTNTGDAEIPAYDSNVHGTYQNYLNICQRLKYQQQNTNYQQQQKQTQQNQQQQNLLTSAIPFTSREDIILAGAPPEVFKPLIDLVVKYFESESELVQTWISHFISELKDYFENRLSSSSNNAATTNTAGAATAAAAAPAARPGAKNNKQQQQKQETQQQAAATAAATKSSKKEKHPDHWSVAYIKFVDTEFSDDNNNNNNNNEDVISKFLQEIPDIGDDDAKPRIIWSFSKLPAPRTSPSLVQKREQKQILDYMTHRAPEEYQRLLKEKVIVKNKIHLLPCPPNVDIYGELWKKMYNDAIRGCDMDVAFILRDALLGVEQPTPANSVKGMDKKYPSLFYLLDSASASDLAKELIINRTKDPLVEEFRSQVKRLVDNLSTGNVTYDIICRFHERSNDHHQKQHSPHQPHAHTAAAASPDNQQQEQAIINDWCVRLQTLAVACGCQLQGNAVISEVVKSAKKTCDKIGSDCEALLGSFESMMQREQIRTAAKEQQTEFQHQWKLMYENAAVSEWKIPMLKNTNQGNNNNNNTAAGGGKQQQLTTEQLTDRCKQLERLKKCNFFMYLWTKYDAPEGFDTKKNAFTSQNLFSYWSTYIEGFVKMWKDLLKNLTTGDYSYVDLCSNFMGDWLRQSGYRDVLDADSHARGQKLSDDLNRCKARLRRSIENAFAVAYNPEEHVDLPESKIVTVDKMMSLNDARSMNADLRALKQLTTYAARSVHGADGAPHRATNVLFDKKIDELLSLLEKAKNLATAAAVAAANNTNVAVVNNNAVTCTDVLNKFADAKKSVPTLDLLFPGIALFYLSVMYGAADYQQEQDLPLLELLQGDLGQLSARINQSQGQGDADDAEIDLLESLQNVVNVQRVVTHERPDLVQIFSQAGIPQHVVVTTKDVVELLNRYSDAYGALRSLTGKVRTCKERLSQVGDEAQSISICKNILTIGSISVRVRSRQVEVSGLQNVNKPREDIVPHDEFAGLRSRLVLSCASSLGAGGGTKELKETKEKKKQKNAADLAGGGMQRADSNNNATAAAAAGDNNQQQEEIEDELDLPANIARPEDQEKYVTRFSRIFDLVFQLATVVQNLVEAGSPSASYYDWTFKPATMYSADLAAVVQMHEESLHRWKQQFDGFLEKLPALALLSRSQLVDCAASFSLPEVKDCAATLYQNCVLAVGCKNDPADVLKEVEHAPKHTLLERFTCIAKILTRGLAADLLRPQKIQQQQQGGGGGGNNNNNATAAAAAGGDNEADDNDATSFHRGPTLSCDDNSGEGLPYAVALIDHHEECEQVAVGLHIGRTRRPPLPSEILFCSEATLSVDVRDFVRRWRTISRLLPNDCHLMSFTLVNPNLLESSLQQELVALLRQEETTTTTTKGNNAQQQDTTNSPTSPASATSPSRRRMPSLVLAMRPSSSYIVNALRQSSRSIPLKEGENLIKNIGVILKARPQQIRGISDNNVVHSSACAIGKTRNIIKKLVHNKKNTIGEDMRHCQLTLDTADIEPLLTSLARLRPLHEKEGIVLHFNVGHTENLRAHVNQFLLEFVVIGCYFDIDGRAFPRHRSDIIVVELATTGRCDINGTSFETDRISVTKQFSELTLELQLSSAHYEPQATSGIELKRNEETGVEIEREMLYTYHEGIDELAEKILFSIFNAKNDQNFQMPPRTILSCPDGRPSSGQLAAAIHELSGVCDLPDEEKFLPKTDSYRFRFFNIACKAVTNCFSDKCFWFWTLEEPFFLTLTYYWLQDVLRCCRELAKTSCEPLLLADQFGTGTCRAPPDNDLDRMGAMTKFGEMRERAFLVCSKNAYCPISFGESTSFEEVQKQARTDMQATQPQRFQDFALELIQNNELFAPQKRTDLQKICDDLARQPINVSLRDYRAIEKSSLMVLLRILGIVDGLDVLIGACVYLQNRQPSLLASQRLDEPIDGQTEAVDQQPSVKAGIDHLKTKVFPSFKHKTAPRLETVNHFMIAVRDHVLEIFGMTPINSSDSESIAASPGQRLTVDLLLRAVAIQSRILYGLPVILLGETGCGKTQTLSWLARLEASNFTIINVHEGMDEHYFLEQLIPFINKAMLPGNTKTTFTVVFDEGNTTKHVFSLKDALADGILGGYRLPQNMRVVILMNPTKVRSDAQQAAVDAMDSGNLNYQKYSQTAAKAAARKDGHFSKARHAEVAAAAVATAGGDDNNAAAGRPKQFVYQVHRSPESICAVMWDFGNAFQIKIPVEHCSRYIRDDRQTCLDLEAGESKITDELQLAHHMTLFLQHRIIDSCPTLLEEFIKHHDNDSGHGYFWKPFRTLITHCLLKSQHYLRHNVYGDEPSVVSLRDMRNVCTITFCLFTRFLPLFRERQTDFDLLTKSLHIAFVLVYCLRLDESIRMGYLSALQQTWNQWRAKYNDSLPPNFLRLCSSPVVAGSFDNSDFYQSFTDFATIVVNSIANDPGIAPNVALKENSVAMLVSIYMRSALFIVGRPGTTKSRSLELLCRAGETSTHENSLITKLNLVIIKYVVQCSPYTTASHVNRQAHISAMRQYGKRRADPDCEYRAVLVLEEVGATIGSVHNPLMSLHSLIDHGVPITVDATDNDNTNANANDNDNNNNKKSSGPKLHIKEKVCVLGLSNYVLDASKQGRAVTLYRGNASVPDLELTARKILYNLDATAAATHLDTFSETFSSHILGDQSIAFFYGMRDFYASITTMQKLMQPMQEELGLKQHHHHHAAFLNQHNRVLTSHVAAWTILVNLSNFPKEKKARELHDNLFNSLTSGNEVAPRAVWNWKPSPTDPAIPVCDACCRMLYYRKLLAAQIDDRETDWTTPSARQQLFHFFATKISGMSITCRYMNNDDRESCNPRQFAPEVISFCLTVKSLRHPMVFVKPTNAGLHLLSALNLVAMDECTVIFESNMVEAAATSNSDIVQNLMQIRACMREGKTLILVRARHVYDTLLDVLNNHYVKDIAGIMGTTPFSHQQQQQQQNNASAAAAAPPVTGNEASDDTTDTASASPNTPNPLQQQQNNMLFGMTSANAAANAVSEPLHLTVLSLAGETKQVFVRPSFRCIILEDIEELSTYVLPPFINRCSKTTLSYDSAFSAMQKTIRDGILVDATCEIDVLEVDTTTTTPAGRAATSPARNTNNNKPAATAAAAAGGDDNEEEQQQGAADGGGGGGVKLKTKKKKMNLLRILVPGYENSTLDSLVLYAGNTRDSRPVESRMCHCLSVKALYLLLLRQVAQLANNESVAKKLELWRRAFSDFQLARPLREVACDALTASTVAFKSTTPHLVIFTEQIDVSGVALTEQVSHVFATSDTAIEKVRAKEEVETKKKAGDQNAVVEQVPDFAARRLGGIRFLNDMTVSTVESALQTLASERIAEGESVYLLFMLDLATSSDTNISMDAFMFSCSRRRFESGKHVALIVHQKDTISTAFEVQDILSQEEGGGVDKKATTTAQQKEEQAKRRQKQKENVEAQLRSTLVFDSKWTTIVADEVVAQPCHVPQNLVQNIGLAEDAADDSDLTSLENLLKDRPLQQTVTPQLLGALLFYDHSDRFLAQLLSSPGCSIGRAKKLLHDIFIDEPVLAPIARVVVDCVHRQFTNIPFERWASMALRHSAKRGGALRQTLLSFLSEFAARAALPVLHFVMKYGSIEAILNSSQDTNNNVQQKLAFFVKCVDHLAPEVSIEKSLDVNQVPTLPTDSDLRIIGSTLTFPKYCKVRCPLSPLLLSRAIQRLEEQQQDENLYQNQNVAGGGGDDGNDTTEEDEDEEEEAQNATATGGNGNGGGKKHFDPMGGVPLHQFVDELELPEDLFDDYCYDVIVQGLKLFGNSVQQQQQQNNATQNNINENTVNETSAQLYDLFKGIVCVLETKAFKSSEHFHKLLLKKIRWLLSVKQFSNLIQKNADACENFLDNRKQRTPAGIRVLAQHSRYHYVPLDRIELLREVVGDTLQDEMWLLRAVAVAIDVFSSDRSLSRQQQEAAKRTLVNASGEITKDFASGMASLLQPHQNQQQQQQNKSQITAVTKFFFFELFSSTAPNSAAQAEHALLILEKLRFDGSIPTPAEYQAADNQQNDEPLLVGFSAVLRVALRALFSGKYREVDAGPNNIKGEQRAMNALQLLTFGPNPDQLTAQTAISQRNAQIILSHCVADLLCENPELFIVSSVTAGNDNNNDEGEDDDAFSATTSAMVGQLFFKMVDLVVKPIKTAGALPDKLRTLLIASGIAAGVQHIMVVTPQVTRYQQLVATGNLDQKQQRTITRFNDRNENIKQHIHDLLELPAADFKKFAALLAVRIVTNGGIISGDTPQAIQDIQDSKLLPASITGNGILGEIKKAASRLTPLGVFKNFIDFTTSNDFGFISGKKQGGADAGSAAFKKLDSITQRSLFSLLVCGGGDGVRLSAAESNTAMNALKVLLVAPTTANAVAETKDKLVENAAQISGSLNSLNMKELVASLWSRWSCGSQHVQFAAEIAEEKLRNNKEIERVKEKINEFMIPKCPHCQRMFVGVNGCARVNCECGMNFCAYCLGRNGSPVSGDAGVVYAHLNAAHGGAGYTDHAFRAAFGKYCVSQIREQILNPIGDRTTRSMIVSCLPEFLKGNIFGVAAEDVTAGYVAGATGNNAAGAGGDDNNNGDYDTDSDDGEGDANATAAAANAQQQQKPKRSASAAYIAEILSVTGELILALGAPLKADTKAEFLKTIPELIELLQGKVDKLHNNIYPGVLDQSATFLFVHAVLDRLTSENIQGRDMITNMTHEKMVEHVKAATNYITPAPRFVQHFSDRCCAGNKPKVLKELAFDGDFALNRHPIESFFRPRASLSDVQITRDIQTNAHELPILAYLLSKRLALDSTNIEATIGVLSFLNELHEAVKVSGIGRTEAGKLTLGEFVHKHKPLLAKHRLEVFCKRVSRIASRIRYYQCHEQGNAFSNLYEEGTDGVKNALLSVFLPEEEGAGVFMKALWSGREAPSDAVGANVEAEDRAAAAGDAWFGLGLVQNALYQLIHPGTQIDNEGQIKLVAGARAANANNNNEQPEVVGRALKPFDLTPSDIITCDVEDLRRVIRDIFVVPGITPRLADDFNTNIERLLLYGSTRLASFPAVLPEMENFVFARDGLSEVLVGVEQKLPLIYGGNAMACHWDFLPPLPAAALRGLLNQIPRAAADVLSFCLALAKHVGDSLAVSPKRLVEIDLPNEMLTPYQRHGRYLLLEQQPVLRNYLELSHLAALIASCWDEESVHPELNLEPDTDAGADGDDDNKFDEVFEKIAADVTLHHHAGPTLTALRLFGTTTTNPSLAVTNCSLFDLLDVMMLPLPDPLIDLVIDLSPFNQPARHFGRAFRAARHYLEPIELLQNAENPNEGAAGGQQQQQNAEAANAAAAAQQQQEGGPKLSAPIFRFSALQQFLAADDSVRGNDPGTPINQQHQHQQQQAAAASAAGMGQTYNSSGNKNQTGGDNNNAANQQQQQKQKAKPVGEKPSGFEEYLIF